MSSDLKNLPDFVSAVGLVVARIALKLSTERRQHFVEGDGQRKLEDDLSRYFAEPAPEPRPVTSQYPADGIEFDLTITESFTGLDIVTRFGYDRTGWKFNGGEVAPQTKRFKLVSIGAQPNFEAVRTALLKHGAIPDGQWCDAFKKAFSQPDGKGPIGVANASWVDPYRNAYFPCVHAGGEAYFRWAGRGCDADWRWLVEVQA